VRVPGNTHDDRRAWGGGGVMGLVWSTDEATDASRVTSRRADLAARQRAAEKWSHSESQRVVD